MVNVPAVRRVIASIRGELPETRNLGFNMASYIYDASELLPDHSGRNREWVGCVCGHTYILETGSPFEQAKNADPDEIEAVARNCLGLTTDQASELFFDLPAHINLTYAPAEFVIDTLERLAATGEVNWIDSQEVRHVEAA
jgi:hypothetical protein